MANCFSFSCGVVALRSHSQISTCKELIQQHADHGSREVISNQADVVTFSVDELCRPGELEACWAKIVVLGTLVTFIGTIAELIRDVRLWFHRVRL